MIDLIGDTYSNIEVLAFDNPVTIQTYIKTMDAMQIFENMVRTSRLIYNDSVMKLNREIRLFPISMIAGMLGFHQKEYLEEQTSRALNHTYL
jgi:hypothetical protein